MIEDRLTIEQRIRLEALNQSAHTQVAYERPQQVVERARVFESYIKDGQDGQDGQD